MDDMSDCRGRELLGEWFDSEECYDFGHLGDEGFEEDLCKQCYKLKTLAPWLEALRTAGFRLEIGGCGCCDSPWITIETEELGKVKVEGLSLEMKRGEEE